MARDPAFSPKQRLPFGKALSYTLFVPLVVYILVYAAAFGSRKGLRSLSLSKFGPVLDYGYEVEHVDADVLIFGDSSAFLGIDPRVVNATLHRRTAVLANTIGSLPLTGNLVMSRYLQHNRKPEILVLYFTPWNLDYERAKHHEFLLEGEEELLRYGSWRAITHAVAAYPLQFLAFPFQELESLGPEQMRHFLRHDEAKRSLETAQAFGHWDYRFPMAPLAAGCQIKPQDTMATAHDTVRQMKERYQKMGMRVFVYLAPIPDCVNTAPVLNHSYMDVNAAKPAVLPASWFANDSFSAHILPPYVRQTSELLASSLSAALVQPSVRH